ncbi:MAG: CopG family transcriptional regulator [Clostridium sp.]|jgi:predicted DNA binding CopG/RHH family protein
MTNEARQKATKKYLKKLDDVIFRVPKGHRVKIKAHAKSRGMSLNAYLNFLVNEDMKKD